MGKLFVKLWIYILLTSLTSFLIQKQVFEWTTQEANANYVQERQRRTFIFVEETLRPFAQAEWPARFDALSRRLGAPARLVPINELSMSGELDAGAVERIRANAIYLRELSPEVGVVMYRAVLDSEYVAALEIPAPPSKRVFGIFKPMVFTWMVECTLYAFAILLWLRLFWRDLKKMVVASENVGAGRFDTEVLLPRGSALKPLGDSFGRMSHRIKTLVTSHKDLTNAVSHELKTPLARLRFAISLVPDAKTEVERTRLLNKMQHDVDELEALVQEMLVYSRLEREAPPIQQQEIAVESWLPNAVDDEIEAAMAEDVRIPVAVSADVADAACEPKFMARAVRNLVRNALRFAKSRVEVRLTQADGTLTIHVDDDGPGIPLEERERLFVPFSKLDQSRSRLDGDASNHSGSGLGLAIVKRVAQWHGGDAVIGDSPIGGARISIHWPVARAN
jgi:two-component system, OmpR family, sensor kinase ParS